MFYDSIIEGNHVADSFYQLSQLNIDLNEPNKAFLFGINYVILTDDTDFREELEKTFEVSYMSEDKIQLEAQLFSTQLLFQYLFSQGRLQDARKYILNQDEKIQEHRVIRNLLAMCYLYLVNMKLLKICLKRYWLKIIQMYMHYVTIHCYFTIRMKKDKYHKYLKILSKVVPMNDDESFKLGIVLSYLKQYDASQQILLPLL